MEDWQLQPAKDLGEPPAERARSLHREAGLLATMGHLGWWSAMRAYLHLYHRLRVEHAERIPVEPPFVMISNHTSHLDAMVLASQVSGRIRDRVFPVAAGDVFFGNPVIAIFSASMINALPLWRKKMGHKAMLELRRRLIDEPCGYIIFPEGTRSRTGEMARFRSGLGMLVAGSRVPVVPCHLAGAYAAMPPGSRFPRPRKLVLRVGPSLTFEKTADNRCGWDEVATQTEAAVREVGGVASVDTVASVK